MKQPRRQRPRGTGSLYRRAPNGPYIAAWHEHTGRRRHVSTRTTDRIAAEKILAKHVADAERAAARAKTRRMIRNAACRVWYARRMADPEYAARMLRRQNAYRRRLKADDPGYLQRVRQYNNAWTRRRQVESFQRAAQYVTEMGKACGVRRCHDRNEDRTD